MPITVAMYDKSLAHIGKRLDALGLDIRVRTFDKSGTFMIDGAPIAPRDIAIDYLWLSTHINTDGFQEGAFGLVLDCKSVGVLQTFNAGLDNPFYKTLARKGTRICSSSAQAVAISEFVFGQVSSVFQPIELQRAQQRDKQWKLTPFREISGTNWLIVGFGPIGRDIAKLAKAFGATTAVVRRRPEPSALADRIGTMADLKTFLPEADVVVLACALNAETRGFADRDFFAALEPGATLVNIARGPLIDETALLAALDGDHLAAAILDVFAEEPLPASHPLWSHPKVRLTPHTSFAGSGGQARWDQLFLDNIARFVKGAALVNEVDPKTLA